MVAYYPDQLKIQGSHMGKFTDRISRLIKPAEKKELKIDELGTIPIDGLNISVTVKAYDSTLGVNSEDVFIRRYVILLTGLSDEGMKSVAAMFKLDERNIKPGQGFLLSEPIPGEALIMGDWMDHMNKDLSKKGLHLPMDAIQKLIDDDLAKQGPGYLQPVKTASQSR